MSSPEDAKLSQRAETFISTLRGSLHLGWDGPEALSKALSAMQNDGDVVSRQQKTASELLPYLESLVRSVRVVARGGSKEAAVEGEEMPRKRRRENDAMAGVDQTGDSEERMEWESGGDRTAAASSEEEGEGAAPRHQRRQTLFSPMLSGGFGADVAEPPAMATAMVRRAPNEPSWARTEVLSSGDLLGHVFSFFLGPTARQGMRRLCVLSLVCRKFREVATREDFWSPLVREVNPAIAATPTCEERAAGSSSSSDVALQKSSDRHRLLRYGQMLLDERRVWCGNHWWRSLELQFEVMDRRDGMQMLTIRGVFTMRSGPDRIDICVASGRRLEVSGPAFSAASRDPEFHRYANIQDYFSGVYSDGTPAGGSFRLCVRAVIKDERTGKTALLWDEESVPRRVHAPSSRWLHRLAPGSLAVTTNEEMRPLATTITSSYGLPPMRAGCYFFITPEPGQPEDTPEMEKLWRLSSIVEPRRQTLHSAPIGITMGVSDEKVVAHWIRSILQHGRTF